MTSSFTNRRNYEKPANGDGDWGSGYNRNFDALEEDLSFSSSKHKKAMTDGNNFRSRDRWEQMDQSSAQGDADTSGGFGGCSFDGRYMYFPPAGSDIAVRYDTTGRFRDIASWEQIGQDSAQGSATLDGGLDHSLYDGRYIYFNSVTNDTHVRFDTTGVFTDITFWENIEVRSAALGANINLSMNAMTFDGRYIYYTARDANTFARYDTNLPFTAITSWTPMDLRSAWGSSATTNTAFLGVAFDGRYAYFGPSASDTVIRYDTTADFQTIASWEQIRMSSATGGSDGSDNFNGMAFDGRHIYYIPLSTDSCVRFDTLGTFTDITDWEQIAISSAQGQSKGADGTNGFSGGSFDGRFIYYCTQTANTMLRYDTTASFTAITSWEQIEQASATGAATADSTNNLPAFDGNWVYYPSAAGGTRMVRYRANITANPGPTEYDQVVG